MSNKLSQFFLQKMHIMGTLLEFVFDINNFLGPELAIFTCFFLVTLSRLHFTCFFLFTLSQ